MRKGAVHSIGFDGNEERERLSAKRSVIRPMSGSNFEQSKATIFHRVNWRDGIENTRVIEWKGGKSSWYRPS
jgi:hypothetical protein